MQKKRIHPDYVEKLFLSNKGEFSLRTEEAFERHIIKLSKVVKEIAKGITCGECTKLKVQRLYRQVCTREPMWN